MKIPEEKLRKDIKDVFDFAVSVIEKQIPMKATYSSPLWYICPKCGGSISIENIQEHIYEADTTYCEHCGQALDWKETFLEYGLEKAYKNWEKLVEESEVVKVVRCKDCKHQDDCARQMVHTTWDYVLEQNISTYNNVDFCSYGKRKDEK